jgi:hypothetical protein
VRKAIEDILDVEGYDDGSYGPLLVSKVLYSLCESDLESLCESNFKVRRTTTILRTAG